MTLFELTSMTLILLMKYGESVVMSVHWMNLALTSCKKVLAIVKQLNSCNAIHFTITDLC